MEPALESIPGVCHVERVGPIDQEPEFLFEMPHGATRREHFEDPLSRLKGPFPENLQDFFYVNTDVGSWECGVAAALALADPQAPGGPRTSLLVRSLIPRTLIDCNRIATEASPSPGLTPLLPDYVTDESDGAWLLERYRAYHAVAERAFEQVCGGGGFAVMVHTYAPRSISIGSLDGDIVRKLHDAYADIERWPLRPQVEVVDHDADGHELSDSRAVEALERAHRERGDRFGRNETYRLFADSAAHRYATRYPGRTLVVEYNRGELADPFTPFGPMFVPADRAKHWVAPLVKTLAARLVDPSRAPAG